MKSRIISVICGLFGRKREKCLRGKAFFVSELTDAEIEAIKNAEPPEEAKQFDHEVD